MCRCKKSGGRFGQAVALDKDMITQEQAVALEAQAMIIQANMDVGPFFIKIVAL